MPEIDRVPLAHEAVLYRELQEWGKVTCVMLEGPGWQLSCRPVSRRLQGVGWGHASQALYFQKIFAELQTQGFAVVETSTLTEEGVMKVKTEVNISCQQDSELCLLSLPRVGGGLGFPAPQGTRPSSTVASLTLALVPHCGRVGRLSYFVLCWSPLNLLSLH